MKLHPGRILGIVMGLVILVAIFVLPFGSGANAQTLWAQGGPLLTNTGSIQLAGNPNMIVYDYLLVIALILLLIAGIVGIFPLGTGVLGVVGMAILTAAPSMIFPNGPVTLSIGAGFVVIWVASIVSLGAVFWHGPKEVTVVQVQPTAEPAVPPSAPEPSPPQM